MVLGLGRALKVRARLISVCGMAGMLSECSLRLLFGLDLMVFCGVNWVWDGRGMGGVMAQLFVKEEGMRT